MQLITKYHSRNRRCRRWMSTKTDNIKKSLALVSIEISQEAEAYSRKLFLRVLQAWAIDRLSSARSEPQMLRKVA